MAGGCEPRLRHWWDVKNVTIASPARYNHRVMIIVSWVVRIALGIIVVDAISSWFLKPNQFPRSLTLKITEPIYAPIRRVIKPEWTGGIDLSPLLLFFLLQAAVSFLARFIP